MGKPKIKKQYPEDIKSLVGFGTVTSATTYAATILSIFMLFLTDYSGIDAAMGQAGYAAAFATAFLLLTRIVDAIDDPLQGWIMDSAKECRFGKYRKFGILGTIFIGIGSIMLFALPSFVKTNGIMLWIWCVIGYLLLDMGSAMNIATPILQKATTDPRIRTKITSINRFGIVLAALPASFFVTIVTAVSGADGDQGQAAVKTAVSFALLLCLITFAGIAMLKEPYRKEKASGDEKSILKPKEIFDMIRHNKPLWAHNIGFFIGNMTYSIASAVMMYFLKWYFCADLATGEVDLLSYAGLVGIYSLISLLPNFAAPFLAGMVQRFCKTVDRGMQFCMLSMSIGYFALFVLGVTGILKANVWLFYIICMIVALPAGISAIFQVLMNVECADYAEYTTGKNMTAVSNSIANVISKAQTAIGGVIPGILLIAVGYSVDSTTGAYAGNLSSLPGMVNGLLIVTTLVPTILSFGGFLIYKLCYKVTPELRKTMTTELNDRHARQSAEAEK